MAEEGPADFPEPDDIGCGGRVVPRQHRSHASPEENTDLPRAGSGSPGGCQTSLNGWAGAHLHGAVRPRRRKIGRGRPPRRWC
ncbi:hypothetical protein [Catenuloplanes indicus]|uniref:Uncharacterized protein n=1 Tax=Catenuloplanes indicus TaxID=137267 RepID=A0AAE4AZN0_9ACTN|nr:hypothetical protein [Catenuloplanes indicus]MDQ0366108.1 hypothetical protein [Catenuloplanes indicus]